VPKLAEAAVLVAGRILNIEDVTKFGTDEVEGKKVLIATGDGFASVKLNNDRVAELHPDFGQAVAWYVRYGSTYNRERLNDATTYSSFVRVAAASDLEPVLALIKSAGRPANTPAAERAA